MKKYIFAILMILSFLLMLPFVWNKIAGENEPDSGQENQIIEEEEVPTTEEVPALEDEKETDNDTETEAGTDLEWGQKPDDEQDRVKEFETVEKEYWADALFIGDSRTVGLSEYADLGGADVFADSGMSVYKAFSVEVPMPEAGKQNLEEVLASRQYGKIYIMMGINELGYDYNKTVENYQKMVDRIQELQPDAVIFLEANLYVTKNKSSKDKIYNNAAIDKMNQAIWEMADNKTRFYVDVNEIFDDAEGNLDTVYTADDAHVLGKYYVQWSEWLLTKGIVS